MIYVSPSILSANLVNLQKDLALLSKAKADYIHIDCMDGHFVDNIAFGPSFVKQIKAISSLPLDVHLMLDEPLKYVDEFILSGSDILTIHQEVVSLNEFMSYHEKLKSHRVLVGLSLRPNTPLENIYPYLPYCDVVLVMSVMPGFSGQKFYESTYQRIEMLNQYRKENHLSYLLEVDGGDDETNMDELKNKGVDIFVSGSYLFKGDMKRKIERMKHV